MVQLQRRGFVGKAVVERGAVVFERSPEPIMDEPEAPAFEGRVSLETLFEAEPFDWNRP